MARGGTWTADMLLDHLAKGDCRILDDSGIGLAARLERRKKRYSPSDVLFIDMAGTATADPGVRQLTFPQFRLVSEKNRRDHWRVKATRTKEQRYTVYYNLRCTYWPLPTLPCTITITRIAPKQLDSHDNLTLACSAVVDGISDWLAGAEGKGQDRIEGLTWQYAQQQGKPREYGLVITIEEFPPCRST